MPHSTRWSNASAPCRPPREASGVRLEWRPSRLLVSGLLLLAMAAAASVLASEMPRLAAWPLASAALGYGVWLAWRESRAERRWLVVASGDAVSTVDGRPAAGLTVRWRGPLAFLHWRDGDGRSRRLVFWPDTLPAPRRRELRLAAPMPVAARSRASMAP